MKNCWKVLVPVCAAVAGVYVYAAHLGQFVLSSLNPSTGYYNLLVQGFRDGQLNLKTEVPPGFARLADPYDPVAHAPYPVLDMSYYKGKLYLYFGATPALMLFWPYVALTGRYLAQANAVVIFCFVGFMAGVGLLSALWRRYFSEVSVWVVAAGALALGLATGVPVMLSRSNVHEVAISCGYMLTMLSLAAIWRALHETERRCWWLAAASATYGLAVGARPSLLFGAVALLVPVAQARAERRPVWALLTAATGPITVIGLGLMLYNAMRFNSPFEFGFRYQLAGVRQLTRQFFSLHYFLFNFRVYFLQPAHWSARFPFVHEIAVPPLPTGHLSVQAPFGILTNIPLVWAALVVPLAWRDRSEQAGSILRWFVTAMALLLGICALTLGIYFHAAGRYEVEFLPALVLLAVIGILSLERVLACEPVWRRVVRWGWSLLLIFSVAFNLFASVVGCAETCTNRGLALERAGEVREATAYFNQALRFEPDYAEAHLYLGMALLRQGRVPDAIAHYEDAIRIKPDYPEAHNKLGIALAQTGRVSEAMKHWEEAIRINPDYPEAQYNYAVTLQELGKVPEAIEHYKQALRSYPDYVEAQYNLGVVLEKAGRVPEAIQHYEQALKLRPDLASARNALARLQAGL